MKVVVLWGYLLWLLSFTPLSAASHVVFTFPKCLPNCTRADMREILQDSDSEKIFIDAIDQAKEDVTFAMYTFSRQPLFEALVRAAGQRHVTIKGFIDRAQLAALNPYCSAGSCAFGAPFSEATFPTLPLAQRRQLVADNPLYKKASLAGKLKLLFYPQADLLRVQAAPGSQRLMHNKFLLTDRHQLITGSGNWSNTAFSINYENFARFTRERDRDVVEAFTCLSDLLATDDAAKIHAGLALCQRADKVYFTPNGDSRQGIAAIILRSIAAAQESIAISMHHLVHEDIQAALLAAAKRAVHIRILFDNDDCVHKTPAYLRQMLVSGGRQVEIKYLPTNCSLFQLSHNKYAIFDERLVINGSANWSQAGLHSNYENFILYREREDVEAFISNFNDSWRLSQVKSACTCDLRSPECRQRFCVGRRLP